MVLKDIYKFDMKVKIDLNETQGICKSYMTGPILFADKDQMISSNLQSQYWMEDL